MRESIRDLGRLQHMLEHINRAEQFAEGKTLADLENDAMQMPIVMDIIQNDLPVLRPQIEAYIKEHPNDTSATGLIATVSSETLNRSVVQWALSKR